MAKGDQIKPEKMLMSKKKQINIVGNKAFKLKSFIANYMF